MHNLGQINIEGTNIFSRITSRLTINTSFKVTPDANFLKYEDFTNIINIFGGFIKQTNKFKISGDYLAINSIDLYFFLFNNNIIIIDQFTLQTEQSIFKFLQKSILFLNDKSKEKYHIAVNKPIDEISKEILFQFDKSDISAIQNKIINSIIRRSQILTLLTKDKSNIKCDINDFVDIKYFNSKVSLSFNLNNQLLYVLKSFSKSDDESMKYCQREIDFYKSIDNKNFFFCQFYGTIEDRQSFIIVIEFIDGQTLENFILDSKGKIDYNEKIKIIFFIIIAIEFAHNKDWVLRDLKWDNIIIDANHNPVFIDFDKAKKKSCQDNNGLVTKIFGSEHFLAPEQYLKGEYSFMSDIYSVAMIIHFIINEKSYDDLLTFSYLGELYESQKSILSNKLFCSVPEEFRLIFETYKKCFEFCPDSRPNATELYYQFFKCVKYKSKFKSLYDIHHVRYDNLYCSLGIRSFFKNNIICDNNKMIGLLKLGLKYKDAYAQIVVGKMHYHGTILPHDMNKCVYYFDLAANQDEEKTVAVLAQITLGSLFYAGRYVKPDYPKSIHYFTLAANLNNDQAQLYLAVIYLEGKITKQDYNKALTYFKLAASNENVSALIFLGKFYYTGHIVRRDVGKSIYYLTKASDKGNPEAQYLLGRIYTESKLIQPNIEKAIHFFTLSADKNYLEAQIILSDIYLFDKSGNSDIKKGIYYLSKAADNNDLLSRFKLGIIYFEGKLIKQDINKAIYHITICSDKNLILAQESLGSIYYAGINTPKDLNRAIKYFTLASNQGSAFAQCQLGLIYLNIDINKSINYLTLSLENGYDYSALYLFIIYSSSEYIPINISKANKLLDIFLSKNNSTSLYMRGISYLQSVNTQNNMNKAIELLTYSAKLKNRLAQYALALIYYAGLSPFIKNDINKAIYFATLSAEGGCYLSKLLLGMIYYEGIYTHRDIKNSISYLKECSSLDFHKAKNNLGVIYKNETKNIFAAILYFNEAINICNSPFALFNLSKFYFFGIGVDKDINISIELMEKAVGNGFYDANIFLFLLHFKSNDEKLISKSYLYLQKIKHEPLAYLLEYEIDTLLLFYEKYDMVYSFIIDPVYDFSYFLLYKEFPVFKKEEAKKPKDINNLFYEGFSINLK